jgi:hypothetical protein
MAMRDRPQLRRKMQAQPFGLEGITPIAFRTVGDQLSAFKSVLPKELLRPPEQLARADAVLVDPVSLAPVRAVPRLTAGSTFDTDGDIPAADVVQATVPGWAMSRCSAR